MPIKRGLSFPLSAENGSLKLSEDADLVPEYIASVLTTRPRERLMQPRLGTPDYVFSSVESAIAIPSRIEVALREQIADPDSFTVSSTAASVEDGTIDIEINYTLSAIAQPAVQFRLRV